MRIIGNAFKLKPNHDKSIGGYFPKFINVVCFVYPGKYACRQGTSISRYTLKKYYDLIPRK